jgi:hypothetical protein
MLSKIWSSRGPMSASVDHVTITLDANGDVNVVPRGSHIGLNVESPTAKVHLAPGEGGAGKGALKFTVAGAALLTTPEVGVLEPFSDDLYYTITTGAARKGVVFTDGFVLTSGRVPYCTTNGRLTDNANFTYSGLALSVPAVSSCASLTNTGNVTVGTFGANDLYLSTDSTTRITIGGTGDVTVAGKFGCNGAGAQASYASGGALAAYVTGAFGLDSDAHMQALFDLVVAIRAALVADGIMS